MATILKRSAWTSTKAKGVAFNWAKFRGIVCHYPAAGRAIGVISKEAVAQKLRGWRNYHVNGRGWSDIGYNYGIDQAGRIWELRGDRVGAHTSGHNSTTIGVLFVVGDNEPLTDEAKQAFRDLRAHLRRKKNKTAVWGHTEMRGASTRCPGPFIMKSIRDGELTGGKASPVKSAPAKPAASSQSYRKVEYGDTLELYTHGEPVKDVQRAVGVHADGFYGPNTKNAVQAFQREHGLAADGVVGPKTWAKINAVKALAKRKPKHAVTVPKFPLPDGHYFGPKSGPASSVSGYYGHRADLKRWQERMRARGWEITADGLYGSETARIAAQFQDEKGLAVDGLIGRETWDAAWKEPVT